MNRVFVKLDSRYANYFPEYSSYFGRALRLLKYTYEMANSGNLFADELTYWLINKTRFKKSQYQMSIYYKYMHNMEQNMLFYLMLMIVYIGKNLKLLDIGLWMI